MKENKRIKKKIDPLYRKVYNIGILIFGYPDAYISPSGEYSGFIIEFWQVIRNQLNTMGIKYKETYLRYKNNNVDWLGLVDKVVSDYDMLIAPLWITEDRLKKVDFCYPLYMTKKLVIYNIKENPNVNYLEWLGNILNLWKIPFVIYFTVSIILGIYIYHTNKISLKKSLYYSNQGFFGQTTGLMFDMKDHKSMHIYRLITLIVILIFNLYLATTAASESVIYLENANKLEKTVKGKKIVVDNPLGADMVRKSGGIPINVGWGNIFDRYTELQYSGVSGFFTGGQHIDRQLCNKKNLRVSGIDLGYEPSAFPMNKKNIEFNKLINKIIIKARDSGEMKDICDNYSPTQDMGTIC